MKLLLIALLCASLQAGWRQVEPVPFPECWTYRNVADGLGDYQICTTITYYRIGDKMNFLCSIFWLFCAFPNAQPAPITACNQAWCQGQPGYDPPAPPAILNRPRRRF